MKCEVNIGDPLRNYAFYSVPAVLSYNKDREFGTVIAESKNKLIVINDENIREHEYLIPKTKVHHCGDNQVRFNISQNTLKEFEI